MADGLNVSRGIGTGEAQVYDTSRPVNYYLQNAAKIEQRRLAEQKALQDELGKVKIDGVRDADRPEYVQKFNDWKNASYLISKEKDPVKKSQLKSEFDKKALELQDFVTQSKQYGKSYTDIKSKLLDNRFRDQFTDDAVNQIQKSDRLPITNPSFIKDFTTLGRTVDTSKFDDELRKIDTDLMSRQQEGNPATGAKVKVGNRMGTNLEYKTTVDPRSQIYNYGMLYDHDKGSKFAIQQQYKELFNTLPEEEAKAQAIADMVAKRPLTKVRNQLVLDDNSQSNHRANRLFDINNPLPSKTSSTASGTPEDLVIPFADGKGVAQGKGYVKVPMATKNFAGTKGAIDLTTGKPVDLSTSSNDYQVVGVANFPFINKSVRDNAGNVIPKGSIAQPNFASKNASIVSEKPMIHVQLKEGELVSDYLVPFDRMPENLTKNDKAILSSFKPSSGQEVPKSAPKTISRSELATKAAASGYSTSEYEKLLKQKGIKIK